MIYIALGNSSYTNTKKNGEKDGYSMFNEIHIEDRNCGNYFF